jgi:hypothetical protein
MVSDSRLNLELLSEVLAQFVPTLFPVTTVIYCSNEHVSTSLGQSSMESLWCFRLALVPKTHGLSSGVLLYWLYPM